MHTGVLPHIWSYSLLFFSGSTIRIFSEMENRYEVGSLPLVDRSEAERVHFVAKGCSFSFKYVSGKWHLLSHQNKIGVRIFHCFWQREKHMILGMSISCVIWGHHNLSVFQVPFLWNVAFTLCLKVLILALEAWFLCFKPQSGSPADGCAHGEGLVKAVEPNPAKIRGW